MSIQKGDGNTSVPSHPEDEERHDPRGQGPQQGDGNFATEHVADQVQDEKLPGVDDFDPGNKISTGAATGTAGQNPAPDTALNSKAKPKPADKPTEENDEDEGGDEEAKPKTLDKSGRKISAASAARLQEVHDHLDHAVTIPQCHSLVKCHVMAAKEHVASMLKDYGEMGEAATTIPLSKGTGSSMNPNGDGGHAGVPPENGSSPQNGSGFAGVPAANAHNGQPDRNSFSTTPAPNGGSPQTAGSFKNPRVDPGTTSNESADGPNIPGSVDTRIAYAKLLMDADELGDQELQTLKGALELVLMTRKEEVEKVNALFEMLV